MTVSINERFTQDGRVLTASCAECRSPLAIDSHEISRDAKNARTELYFTVRPCKTCMDQTAENTRNCPWEVAL